MSNPLMQLIRHVRLSIKNQKGFGVLLDDRQYMVRSTRVTSSYKLAIVPRLSRMEQIKLDTPYFRSIRKLQELSVILVEKQSWPSISREFLWYSL